MDSGVTSAGLRGSGLTISGGGSFAVASDALFTDAQALESVAEQLRGVVRALVAADALVGTGLLRRADAPASAHDADAGLQSASRLVHEAGARADTIALLLRLSAEGYGRAERIGERVAQELAARLGHGLGLLLPLTVATMLPALPVGLAGLALGALMAPGWHRAVPGTISGWLGRNNRVLTNPVTVLLVRAGVMSIDDVIGGAIGMPDGLVRALGDEGAGLAGIASSAVVVVGVGSRFGLLTESPVVAREVSRARVASAPAGLAERIDRIPQRVHDARGEPEGPHVTIERYRQAGREDRFEVYITGTADFSPAAGGEPFDLTSDVVGMAGMPAGSIRAVELAMADAGVTADSPVQFTGFSQGGLIAARLAASGEYNTQGVFTAGAPTGQIAMPDGVPVISLEHSDDIVPALGGMRQDHNAVLVEREAFAGREPPEGVAVPSHSRPEYRHTAVLAERAGSDQVSGVVDSLDGFGAGATSIVSTSYVAERVREGG
jgi:hypothetical protein